MTAYGKGTFKVFGVQDETGFLDDKHTIRESVEDGTTVPLHYALAANDLRVYRATLEAEFLKLAEAEAVSDIEELNKTLERAVTLKHMLINRDWVDRVARFVAEHFLGTVEPMGCKGFLVGGGQHFLVQDAAFRGLLLKPGPYSKVNSGRQQLTQLMQNERGLVGDDHLRLVLAVPAP